MTPPLSVLFLVKDEADRLPAALDGVTWADEVVVVDTGSTDATRRIAAERGARVVSIPWEGWVASRNRALAEAAHDWVLCLDADEEVTPELAAAIRELLAGGQPTCAAYRFRFVTAFMGRPLIHGAASSRYPIRLFDRRRAEWSSAPVAAELGLSGIEGHLPGAVLHHALRDLSDSIAKMDTESSLAALGVAMSGRCPGGLAIVLTAAFQFLRHYVLKQSFRDGFPGLAWSFVRAVESSMKYLKARELVACSGSGPGPNAGAVDRLPRRPAAGSRSWR